MVKTVVVTLTMFAILTSSAQSFGSNLAGGSDKNAIAEECDNDKYPDKCSIDKNIPDKDDAGKLATSLGDETSLIQSNMVVKQSLKNGDSSEPELVDENQDAETAEDERIEEDQDSEAETAELIDEGSHSTFNKHIQDVDAMPMHTNMREELMEAKSRAKEHQHENATHMRTLLSFKCNSDYCSGQGLDCGDYTKIPAYQKYASRNPRFPVVNPNGHVCKKSDGTWTADHWGARQVVMNAAKCKQFHDPQDFQVEAGKGVKETYCCEGGSTYSCDRENMGLFNSRTTECGKCKCYEMMGDALQKQWGTMDRVWDGVHYTGVNGGPDPGCTECEANDGKGKNCAAVDNSQASSQGMSYRGRGGGSSKVRYDDYKNGRVRLQ